MNARNGSAHWYRSISKLTYAKIRKRGPKGRLIVDGKRTIARAILVRCVPHELLSLKFRYRATDLHRITRLCRLPNCTKETRK